MKNYDEDFDYEYAEDYELDYIVDGIELDLIDEAYPTGRCLLYNPDGNLFEMEALAVGRDHKRYFVRWIFEDNGEESYDAYDYSAPYECVLIDQPSKGLKKVQGCTCSLVLNTTQEQT